MNRRLQRREQLATYRRNICILMDDWRGLSSQCARLFSVYFRYVLQPAVARGIPLYLIVLILGPVILSALPIHRLLANEPNALPVVALLWCALSSPVRRELFGSAEFDYLRSLPIPRFALTAAVFIGLLAADFPWLLLCFASGNWVVFVVGPTISPMMHAAFGLRGLTGVVVFASLLLASTTLPLIILLPLGLVACFRIIPNAWGRTPAEPTTWWNNARLCRPWLAIARALASALAAELRQFVGRLSLAMASLIAMSTLAVRNNGLASPEAILQASLLLFLLGLPWICSRIACRILEIGWELNWLCEATGTSVSARVSGGLVVMGAVGGVLGGLHGVGVALLTEPTHCLHLAASESFIGALISLIIQGTTATCVGSQGIDRQRQASAILIVSIAFPIIVGNSLLLTVGVATMLGALAVLPYAGVARAPILIRR